MGFLITPREEILMSLIQSMNASTGRKQPVAYASKPVSMSAGQMPPIRFGHIASEQDKAYQQELMRIQRAEKPLIRNLMGKQVFLMSLRLFFPASYMSSLKNFTQLFKMPEVMAEAYKVQARFAVTHDLNDLNPYLPYRQFLKKQGDQKTLAEYDKVLQHVLKQAEFYETSQPKKLQKDLKALWSNKAYRKELRTLTGNNLFKFMWNFLRYSDYRTEFLQKSMQLQQKHMETLNNQKLLTIFKTLKPLPSKDIATKTLVAGEITDLFFKNPGYLEQVLKNNKGFPLRFVITKDAPKFAVGSLLPGLNTITLNRSLLWYPPGENTTAQHEFIHAASGHNGMVGELLPYMSPSQQTQFKNAREWLMKQHETKASSFLGKMKYRLIGKSVTGIRNYAFANNYEFLTVTLDTFKSNPQGLCQTEAGKSIYAIYKDLFGLDPLNELKKKDS